jgi:predicted glutamine amidotransferase
MCVIVIKPRGKKLLPKSILKKCWEANSHGAGYAINHKGDQVTTVQKGFMDFDAFYKALQEENVCKRDLLLLHFRISTHGYKSPEHTHPFPISTKKEDLELLAYETNMVCAHNGIFHLKDQPNDISDTMYYIQGWLSTWDLARLNSEKTDLKDVIDSNVSYSKVALIVNGTMHMLGNWTKHQGCYYSNTGPLNIGYQYAGWKTGNDLVSTKWPHERTTGSLRRTYGYHRTFEDTELYGNEFNGGY